ncbi:MAG: Serine/threonine protein kinase [Bacteroidota bacterium]|nr:Serine/threonine protein kinase [Bacteroidota bacterium]
MDALVSKEFPENLAEPIIFYSLYILDSRINRRIELQAPEEFTNQFAILNGQTIELHWNVLNADWISIQGVGFVQAIGKKEFYPEVNTQYKITAKNRNHIAEREFFVRVFPVPVLEKLLVPMPELSSHQIHLFRQPLSVIGKPSLANFPSLKIPSMMEIGKDNSVAPPQKVLMDKTLLLFSKDKGGNYTSFKSNLFDKLENKFKENYKLKDIIHTIRKHYEV